MALMPLTLAWSDVFIRLALAALAGALIGWNRDESGKGAGLRTTLLVCLAACLAMLQVNALLSQSGKEPGFFATLDLMRLPLGILSGVGFIGAGAILRKDGLVKGVTTAATLWFVTVVGLCFGGGQLGLGAVGLLLGIVVLWCLKRVESRLARQVQADLKITYVRACFSPAVMSDTLKSYGCELLNVGETTKGDVIEQRFEVRWHARPDAPEAPPFIDAALKAGANEIEWAIAR